MDDEVMGNAAYYRRREASEREMAEGAPSPDIRKIHLQLAKRYLQLAEEFEAQGRIDGRSNAAVARPA